MDKVKHEIHVGIFALDNTSAVFVIEELMIEFAVEMCCIAVFNQSVHNMLLENAL